MARTVSVVVVCDPCLDEGTPDVPAISVEATIGDVSGILDLCRQHRPLVEQVRQLLLKHGRALDRDKPCRTEEGEQPAPPERPAQPEQPALTETEVLLEPHVTCGLCGEPVALKYRSRHASKAHDMKAGQITWEGDLPHSCPSSGCKYAAASPAGLASHIRHEHPELGKPKNPKNKARAA